MFNTIAPPRVALLRRMGMQHVKVYTTACRQHVMSRGAAREMHYACVVILCLSSSRCLRSPLTRPTRVQAACAPSSCPDRKTRLSCLQAACTCPLPSGLLSPLAYLLTREAPRPGSPLLGTPLSDAIRSRLAHPFMYASTSLPFWFERKKLTLQ